jgi:hypothetical protein
MGVIRETFTGGSEGKPTCVGEITGGNFVESQLVVL